MKTSKTEEMHNWLEANPGKTKRDWLIEVRCTSDEQRKLLKEVFASCGEEYIQIPATIYIGGAGEATSLSNRITTKSIQRFWGATQSLLSFI